MDEAEVDCWLLPTWLAEARAWQCDTVLVCPDRPGSASRCHSAVLAALSPVLAIALAGAATQESDQFTVISEHDLPSLLDMFYWGRLEAINRRRAAELWAALADLGLDAELELVQQQDREVDTENTTTLMTIVLGAEETGQTHQLLPPSPLLHNVPTDNVFTYPGQLLRDLNTDKVVDEQLKCTDCGDDFANEISLRTHVTDFHMDLKCNECSISVKGNCNLVKHTVEKHTSRKYSETEKNTTIPSCDICNMTFATNQALRFHQYKHNNLKPYKCKFCDASFRTPSTLKSHQIQHTEAKNKCEICGMKSSTTGKLKIHMRTHSDDKPYQCSFCPSNFRQLSVLRVHEFVHTKKSNHKCEKCGTYFPTKNRLIHHLSKPICLTRNRGSFPVIRTRKLQDSSRFLGDLDTGFDNDLGEKVTYYIHNDSIDSNPVKTLAAVADPYDQSLGYQADALNSLDTGDIPVLVDSLPVIIHTDIGSSSRHLDGKSDLEKEEEMMFNL